jgi:ABC-2 type transport system permease protein
VRNVRTVVVDRDVSSESRSLVRALTGSGYFKVIEEPASDAEISRVFEKNQARLAIVIPRGLAQDLAAGRDGEIQAIVDGADANTATTILNYVQALVADDDARIVTRYALKSGRELPGIDVRARVWFNPELRSTFFLLPGLIAFIMMLSAVVSTALSVVREKERGTLEQLRITPMATTELLVGKTIPYLVVSLLSMTIVLTTAHFLFGLRIAGSLVQLYLVSLLFLVGALSFGLLISSMVARQQDAFQIAGLTSMLPTVLLSGFIFPIRAMPLPLQWLSHIVPARYFVRILRGIILKGAPATAYPWDLLALVLYAGAVLFLASSRLSSKRA